MKQILSLFLIVILLFTSCGLDVSSLVPNTEPESEVSSVLEKEPDSLAVVSQARPNQTFGIGYVHDGILDPFEPTHQMNYDLANLLYDKLFVIGSDGSTMYALCDTLSTEDSITYTLTIRSGVFFHNGSPLTAADVEYSLQRARSSSLYARSLSCISSSAYDNAANTVTIVLGKKLGSLPSLLTFPIVSRSGGVDYEYHNYALLGSGRYYIDIEVMEETEYTYLQENSSWYGNTGSKSAVPRIDLFTVSTQDELVHRYFNSDIDILSLSSSQNDNPVLQGDAEKHIISGNSLLYIGFNTSLESFSTPESRLAIYHLIDRGELTALFGEKEYIPVQYPIRKESRTASFLEETLLPDESQVSSLLRKAGFYNSRGSRALEFKSNTFSLVLLACSDSNDAALAAGYLQEKLESVNFTVELKLLPYKEYIDALDKGKFNLYIGTTNPSVNYDYEYLVDYTDLFASLQEQFNQTASANKIAGVPEGMRKILSDIQALNTYDPLYSLELAEHIQLLFDDYMPFVPLCFDTITVYLRGNFVSGIEVSNQDIFYNIELWETPK